MKSVKKVFGGVLIFLGVLIVVVVGWFLFSAFDKKSSLSKIPEDFAIVLHADSLYNGLAPLIELKAAETLLAEPSLSAFRGAFMKAREISGGAHPIVKKVVSRRADVAFYKGNKFIVVLDLSYLSGVTRFFNIAGNFISSKVKNMGYDSEGKLFVYDAGSSSDSSENSKFYVRFEKNLAVITLDSELMELAFSDPSRTNQALSKLLSSNSSGEIKIIADSRKIGDSIFEGNKAASRLVRFIKSDSLTSISFSITNDDLDLKLKLPIEFENSENETSGIANLLQKKSIAPSLFSKLSDGTQYFTLLNFASLDDIVAAAFEMFPEKNLSGLWKKANDASKAFFNLDLDELMFSWSGKEVAVLGLEDSNSPVFAFQVKDEKKLREVLDVLDRSILIKNNMSLIVGGMRIPCLELPAVFANLISAFGYEIPRPYYLVQNGFIYFSEAPQNLSAIYSSSKENAVLAKTENWREVGQKMNSNTSFCVYYDLKRSLPFFVDGNNVVSKILKLYTLGRCDLTIFENEVALHLHSVSSPEKTTRLLAGFPIQTKRVSEFSLEKAGDSVFWIEEGLLSGLDLKSLNRFEYPFSEKFYVSSAPNDKLWAATESGDVYLFNKNLSVESGFPVVTGSKVMGKGTSYGKEYFIPVSGGKLLRVSENGKTNEIFVSEDANFRSAPAISKDGTIALYNRGFEGEIFIVKHGKCVNSENPIYVDGIGFGSPVFGEWKNSDKGSENIAFLTQSGTLYIFDEDGNDLSGFPLEIDDVFYMNVVFFNGAFYALSENAVLYKIYPNGNFIQVQLPDTVSAKEGIITAVNSIPNRGIYISGDNNILFGFNSELELMHPFPLAGRGKPVFADVNKNGKGECIVLSTARELSAWRLK